MNYYLKVLKNYTNFDGRARRSEYWYFILFHLIIVIGLTVLDVVLGLYNPDSGSGVISGLYQLGVFIPTIAVGVRRMHDVGKSGWFILFPIYNLILTLSPGDIGDNEYGADPKTEAITV